MSHDNDQHLHGLESPPWLFLSNTSSEKSFVTVEEREVNGNFIIF